MSRIGLALLPALITALSFFCVTAPPVQMMVWPTWTPVPTAISRLSATPMGTKTMTRTITLTEMPTWTATPTFNDLPPSVTPTLPACNKPWPFTRHERLNIQAAALNQLWTRFGSKEEPPVEPWKDEILAIGLWGENLGCPMTDEVTLLADDGVTRIRARGFALGIVAVTERADVPAECQRWAVIEWSGEECE